MDSKRLPDVSEWQEAHVTPTDDLIAHTSDEDCICGPECQPIERPDGSVTYVYVHHSLDGREAAE